MTKLEDFDIKEVFDYVLANMEQSDILSHLDKDEIAEYAVEKCDDEQVLVEYGDNRIDSFLEYSPTAHLRFSDVLEHFESDIDNYVDKSVSRHLDDMELPEFLDRFDVKEVLEHLEAVALEDIDFENIAPLVREHYTGGNFLAKCFEGLLYIDSNSLLDEEMANLITSLKLRG